MTTFNNLTVTTVHLTLAAANNTGQLNTEHVYLPLFLRELVMMKLSGLFLPFPAKQELVVYIKSVMWLNFHIHECEQRIHCGLCRIVLAMLLSQWALVIIQQACCNTERAASPWLNLPFACSTACMSVDLRGCLNVSPALKAWQRIEHEFSRLTDRVFLEESPFLLSIGELHLLGAANLDWLSRRFAIIVWTQGMPSRNLSVHLLFSSLGRRAI